MFNERLMKLTATSRKILHFPPFFKVFKWLWVFIILCSFLFSTNAQKGFSIEPTLHFGSVTKHTSKLTFDVKGPSYGADINFKFQTYGKKEWQEWRKFPLFGVTALWLRFGNNSVLGNAFSITPNLSIPLFNKRNWQGYYQIGIGYAYMTKKFDVVNNPENNAIGSNSVSTILMKFYTTRQLNSKWKLNAGISLNHFSNGGARLPNFGLNVPALMIGFNYAPQPLLKDQFFFHNKNKKRIRKFGFDLQTGFGLVQRFAIGGPRFPIYIFGVRGKYYLNRVNRLVAGFEYEQNRAIYSFTLHTYNALTRDDARKKASRLMFVVGDEFLFGSLSITLQLGVYLGNFSFLKPATTYTKFTTRYYLPSKGILKHKMFLEVALKTHLTVAEYISIGTGINF